MSLAGKRVLVVEDEMLIALDTVDELKSAGCTVLGPVLRLAAAIPLALTEQIDAAVLDVNLAGQYVWPVAEALAGRAVPFIFVTGFGNALEFPPAFASVSRLDKPIRPGAVTRTLASLLFPA
ncbi:MAG: response regulator [Rhodomicrobium sp.]